ncbi:hypothetical protein [Salipiger thiooxidans]|uniref:hypothetical protein n=1 Tax=Salipiger thiooxidans TaxID=282683 RepID=UPI001CD6532D|nr:hypothetical protein [Salipiger thiooxidans]MCA0846107.1 hypothetical protein [Salipiger thiooxidans]
MTTQQLKRPQVIDQELIEALRDVLDAAERGEVTGIVLCANMADDKQYYRASAFQDGWTLLGALEYAKECILLNMRAE